MIKYFPCTSWNTTELNNILLNTIKCLIWHVLMFNMVISVYSVIISITNFDIIFDIFTLHHHHKLLERFIIHKLDVWRELQSSGNATTGHHLATHVIFVVASHTLLELSPCLFSRVS